MSLTFSDESSSSTNTKSTLHGAFSTRTSSFSQLLNSFKKSVSGDSIDSPLDSQEGKLTARSYSRRQSLISPVNLKRQRNSQIFDVSFNSMNGNCIKKKQNTTNLKFSAKGRPDIKLNISKSNQELNIVDGSNAYHDEKKVDFENKLTQLEYMLCLRGVKGPPYNLDYQPKISRRVEVDEGCSERPEWYQRKKDKLMLNDSHYQFLTNIQQRNVSGVSNSSHDSNSIRVSMEDAILFKSKPKDDDDYLNHSYNVPNTPVREIPRNIFCNMEPQPIPLTFKTLDTECSFYSPNNDKVYLEQMYNMGQLLGDGSFGEVFLSTNKKTGRKLAIKRFRAQYRSRNERHVMTTEVRNMMEIGSHVNIVGLDNAWEQRKRIYIALESCLFSMADVLKVHGALEIPMVWDVACDMISGIKHIHGQFYVHLDIKPENIMVSEFGIYKLGDFGLSRNLSEETMETDNCEGDTKYLAPEVLQNVVTEKADIFALGVTLFEFVTNVFMPRSGTRWAEIISSESFPLYLLKNCDQDMKAVIYDSLCSNHIDRPSIYNLSRRLGVEERLVARIKRNIIATVRGEKRTTTLDEWTCTVERYINFVPDMQQLLTIVENDIEADSSFYSNFYQKDFNDDILQNLPTNRYYDDYRFRNDMPSSDPYYSKKLNFDYPVTNLTNSLDKYMNESRSIQEKRKVTEPVTVEINKNKPKGGFISSTPNFTKNPTSYFFGGTERLKSSRVLFPDSAADCLLNENFVGEEQLQSSIEECNSKNLFERSDKNIVSFCSNFSSFKAFDESESESPESFSDV